MSEPWIKETFEAVSYKRQATRDVPEGKKHLLEVWGACPWPQDELDKLRDRTIGVTINDHYSVAILRGFTFLDGVANEIGLILEEA